MQIGHTKKKTIAIILMIAIVVAGTALYKEYNKKIKLDQDVLATVNGVSISQDQFNSSLTSLPDDLQFLFRSVS